MIDSTAAAELGKAGPACPDLRALLGDRFKIGHDPAYFVEHGRLGRSHDPWLLLIPCRFGHILPWTETELAASVDGHPNIAGAIARLEFTRIIQNGDDGELTAAFTVDHFADVVEIMHPHRRRQWSDEQRRKVAEQQARYLFPPVIDPHHTAEESPRSPKDVHSPTQPIQSPNLAPIHD